MAELDEAGPRLTHTITVPGDGTVTLALDGELDIATSDDLNAAVQDAISRVATCLVVDVERLRFADSSGIALWVNWSRQVPKVEIRNPRPMVRRVIETMGLASILNPS